MKPRRLVLSTDARADLTDIWFYIAERNPLNADRFARYPQRKCQKLADAPEMGRKRDELAPGLRSFVVKNYVIFYRIKDEALEIVRVLSALRDIEAIFNPDGI